MRNADRGADERLAVQLETAGRKLPPQGIADDGQVAETKLLAAQGGPGMGDDLAPTVENHRQQPRFGGRTTDEFRKPVDGDLADERVLGHRNRQGHGEPAGHGGQKSF
ncbi:MAG: hypothetical protein V9H25_16950 [Candidatus Competibacter sp.]